MTNKSEIEYEKRMVKAAKHHFNNMDRLARKPEPSKEELEEMYSYLGFCLICEKPLRFGEPFQHGFEGNVHRFGCTPFKRILGWIFNFLKMILLLILIIPFGIYECLKWMVKRFTHKLDYTGKR
ncbi:MAG: hypothetical protein ABIH82_03970 [Candidatus Woesearchaeota archaeon]